MNEAPKDQLAERLKALEDRLNSNREKENRAEARKPDNTGFANALKMSTEFVAAVLVGAGIGFLIDNLAGTAPWAMIVFLLLGFVAGVLNVLRSAGLVADPANRLDDQD